MKYKDYYEALGVSRTSTQDEIKTAYRRLARKYHPDLNKEAGAEERFKEIAEAYEVLKDPEKRATYDRVGTAPNGDGQYQTPPDWNEGFSYQRQGASGADENMFDGDFFESLFGHASQARQRRQPQNLDQHAVITVDLEDTFTGAQRTITLQTQSVDAQGHLVMTPRTLNVTIPKGIRAGQRLRLAKQGLPGHDGAAGDLYLEIQWAPHPLYHTAADSRDLSIELPVAPWETALGADITIPTPQGNVSLAIPPNSANGKRLRLKGRGIPAASATGEAGDLYVILNIVYPDANTEAAKAAYAALRDATHFDPRAHFPRG